MTNASLSIEFETTKPFKLLDFPEEKDNFSEYDYDSNIKYSKAYAYLQENNLLSKLSESYPSIEAAYLSVIMLANRHINLHD